MERSTNGGSGNVDNMSFEKYKLGKTLGIGSFGKVKTTEHALTGFKVAFKILNRHNIRNMNLEEKGNEKKNQNPHLIRLYEVIEAHNDIYLVMEYAECGELFDYVIEKGRLQEDEARYFFKHKAEDHHVMWIISCVEYCHKNDAMLGNLKPGNLLLDAKHDVKIKTGFWSPNYAPPEVISNASYSGPEVDVWSCGIIFYTLLSGTLPSDDESIPLLFKKIMDEIYDLTSHLSPGARDLIARMLLVDPMKRITIPEILRHQWFRLPHYLAAGLANTMQQA